MFYLREGYYNLISWHHVSCNFFTRPLNLKFFFPHKVVICASQIFWTSEVHEAIRAGPHGLPEYQEKLTKQV